MSDVADQVVRWLLDRVQMAATPPVDVEELARRMGIESIRSASMLEDGRLEQDGRTAVIYLRQGLPEDRRRFTIAHELGHRLLLHPQAPAERFRRRLAGDAEERFCDEVAAAILLPRQWVATNFNTAPQRLQTIRDVRRSTGTSLSASLVRLREVAGWKESLLVLKFAQDRWRLHASAGVPFEIHGSIRTTDDTSRALAAVGHHTRQDFRAVLPLSIAHRSYEAPAELSVGQSVAVALVGLQGFLRTPSTPPTAQPAS